MGLIERERRAFLDALGDDVLGTRGARRPSFSDKDSEGSVAVGSELLAILRRDGHHPASGCRR